MRVLSFSFSFRSNDTENLYLVTKADKLAVAENSKRVPSVSKEPVFDSTQMDPFVAVKINFILLCTFN